MPSIEQDPLLAVTVPCLSAADPVIGVEQVAFGVNVAVTFCAALMVTEQEPVPVQLPLQPVKVLPPAAFGVSVTTVPAP